MSRKTKVSIRQKDWDEYREFVLKCPSTQEESQFSQKIVNRLREGRGLVIGIDTLMLNVRYGVNTSGYAEELTRELENCGFPYKHRRYLVRQSRGGLFTRFMDRVSKMQNEHHLVVFSIPQLSDLRQNISLRLPGEGTIQYISSDGDDTEDVLKFLVSPETTEDQKYDRLLCMISDGREHGELSICTRYLSIEDVLQAVKG